MKRIIAFALVLIFCFSLVSCGKEEAPDGMYLVSGEGEPFKLFVPNSWKDNTSSGVVGAYFLLSEKISVTARYYTPSEDISLEDYAYLCESEYAESIDGFSSKGIGEAVLGGENARELVFEFEEKIEGKTVDYICRQIFVKYKGDFVTLSFYCPEERYDSLNTEQFDKIVEEFRLCEKEEDTGDEVTDKKTPDKMKIASADKLEYVMYVPTSWVCNSRSGASEAYYPESGKPNVTVTSYSDDTAALTPESYFELCEEEYKEALPEYELLDSFERTVSDREAVSFVYTTKVGEADVKIMQTVFEFNSLLYSFTYTALEDSYDAHIDDVDAMLDAFRLR